jgi:hypothetical protein
MRIRSERVHGLSCAWAWCGRQALEQPESPQARVTVSAIREVGMKFPRFAAVPVAAGVVSNSRALLPPGAATVDAATRQATRRNAVAGGDAFTDSRAVAKLTTAAAGVAVVVVNTRVTRASSTPTRDRHSLLRRAASGPDRAPGCTTNRSAPTAACHGTAPTRAGGRPAAARARAAAARAGNRSAAGAARDGIWSARIPLTLVALVGATAHRCHGERRQRGNRQCLHDLAPAPPTRIHLLRKSQGARLPANRRIFQRSCHLSRAARWARYNRWQAPRRKDISRGAEHATPPGYWPLERLRVRIVPVELTLCVPAAPQSQWEHGRKQWRRDLHSIVPVAQLS